MRASGGGALELASCRMRRGALREAVGTAAPDAWRLCCGAHTVGRRVMYTQELCGPWKWAERERSHRPVYFMLSTSVSTVLVKGVRPSGRLLLLNLCTRTRNKRASGTKRTLPAFCFGERARAGSPSFSIVKHAIRLSTSTRRAVCWQINPSRGEPSQAQCMNELLVILAFLTGTSCFSDLQDECHTPGVGLLMFGRRCWTPCVCANIDSTMGSCSGRRGGGTRCVAFGCLPCCWRVVSS